MYVCDDFLLIEMVYKTNCNFVKSMPRSIFPFQQIQIHPNPSQNKFFTCGRATESRPNHQKLPWVSQVDHLGHIIHESGSQDIDCREARGAYTLDFLLNYWEFSISAHHCKSYLLCKLIAVPFVEAIFGTFTASIPIKHTDPGTLQLKFAGTYTFFYEELF